MVTQYASRKQFSPVPSRDRLGHSNPSITLAIYSHWFKGAKGGATAERLAKMVVGISEPRGMWPLSGHSDENNSRARAAVA
jgi:hypothetical protein